MSSFFGSSPLEKRIEAATSESLIEAPIELYLEIATEVSKSNDAGAAHLKAIKKRLQSKSPQIQYLAVQLLDVCVKNGKDSFHETVSHRDFLDFFAQFAQSNKIPHIKEHALSMIQSWARAFPQTGLTSFSDVYKKLKFSGVPFPDDKESKPVLTPPMNLSVVAQRKHSARTSSGPDRSPVPRSPNKRDDAEHKQPHPLSTYSAEYVARVKSESLQVLEYIRLLRDMLLSSTGPSDVKNNEAIIGLQSTVLDCRNRVAHLLVELDHELLMELMLTMNELIRVTLEFYQAKLTGKEIAIPALDTPLILQPPSASAPALPASTARGEADHDEKDEKEHKVSAPSASSSAGSDFDSMFAGLSVKGSSLGSSAPAPASSAPSSTSLDQFDPLAG